MGVVCLSYKCRKMHKLDHHRVFALLNPQVDNKNLMKEIREHLRHGECFKLQKNEVVVGVFLAMKYDTHYSLSYFFLNEEVRRKPITLHFFIFCMRKLNPLFEVFVMKNKNYETYKKYFTETEDENVLKFSGLRDSSLDDKFKGILEWVE